MVLPWFQICSLLGLSLMTLFAALIPYIFVRCYRRKNFNNNTELIPRSWFYCFLLFAAAIVLTTGITHVFPNSIESMDDFKDGFSYPYAYIIISFSLLCCWILDILFDPDNAAVELNYGYELREDGAYPVTTPYFFTFALIMHSVLEGIVLGSSPIEQETQSTNPTKYLYILFVVLGVHKCLEGFSLGTIYEAYGFVSNMKFISLFVLSISTSTGVVIGLLLIDILSSTNLSLLAGVICSVATGIYIYAGAALLMHKPPGWGRNNYRFLSVLLGWILPCAISWLIYLDL